MLAMTAAACDARMDGAMIPVMSNSGSGNQGIAATLPVLSFAEDIECSEEQLIRALMLSHLMVIYINKAWDACPPFAVVWWPPREPVAALPI